MPKLHQSGASQEAKRIPLGISKEGIQCRELVAQVLKGSKGRKDGREPKDNCRKWLPPVGLTE